MKLPNFFLVGVPKSGTTSLYAYLGQHPQIYMSPTKEPGYFGPELWPQNFEVVSWEDYLGLFRDVSDEIAIGEATAGYLWSATAAHSIAARIPHARIIINLRNPVDRAYSEYLQIWASGLTRRSFRDQIDASLPHQNTQVGHLRRFLESGHYCEQIKRYLSVFPRSQIYISYYEGLERAPERLMADLFAFLGVDPGFVPDVSRRHNEPHIPRLDGAVYFLRKARLWPYLRKLAPRPFGPRLQPLLLRPRTSIAMAPADRAYLTDYYREEIRHLEALLDRDLSAWLNLGAAGQPRGVQPGAGR